MKAYFVKFKKGHEEKIYLIKAKDFSTAASEIKTSIIDIDGFSMHEIKYAGDVIGDVVEITNRWL